MIAHGAVVVALSISCHSEPFVGMRRVARCNVQTPLQTDLDESYHTFILCDPVRMLWLWDHAVLSRPARLFPSGGGCGKEHHAPKCGPIALWRHTGNPSTDAGDLRLSAPAKCERWLRSFPSHKSQHLPKRQRSRTAAAEPDLHIPAAFWCSIRTKFCPAFVTGGASAACHGRSTHRRPVSAERTIDKWT